MSKKKTNEEFMIDGYCKHGDKFNYKFVEYKGSFIKIIIICNTCGYIFEQMPSNHLQGKGCPQCAIKRHKEKRTKTHKQFENEVRNIHGDKFEYLTKYVNNRTHMTMKCNTCGYIFKQRPSDHLCGQGCPQCAIKRHKEKRTKTHKQFENEVRNIHGDKFEYLTKYVNAFTHMIMKCNTCGCVFEQTPSNHLQGKGCPQCAGRFREKYSSNNIPVFIIYQPQLEPYGVKCRRSPKDKNILEVRCMYCGKWHQPSLNSVINKISVINGKSKGERNLYCSDNCKLACPTYRQRKYPKGFKQATSREVQSVLRKLVLERDNWICQKCGSTNKQLHCHHITGIELNPIESADIDNCITLCKDCHNEVHQQKGCTYNDFKRKDCKN